MAESRNNFKEEENRKASPYKLWMLNQWNYVKPGGTRRTEVLYAYNTKTPYTALNFLITQVEKQKFKIEKAIIYNNKTNKEHMYFDKKTMMMKDWVHY